MDSNGSRDERRRQTFPDRDTAGRAKAVKPPGFSQRAEPSSALQKEVSKATGDAGVWERVFQRDNLLRALARVERNGGAPGIDGMTVEELRPYLKRHWPEIRAVLDAETYQPKPVLRREIPKPGGGVRLLGIPTVIDRFIQQALAQVLTPLFEPVFSDSSYGFRPGRRAHDAVRRAQAYINEGYGWVVDIDLEKFFDRVNHDKLMARVARVVKDRRVLKLIRKYLESGVMVNGVVVEMREGTPQGGPLSPLLANIMLDDLDKELEKRGHRFVRYADDCNIYVRSRRAGERLLAGIGRFLERKLRLRVNAKKSGVDRPQKRKFLSFSFYWRQGQALIRVAGEAKERCLERLRRLTRRGRSGLVVEVIRAVNEYTTGWMEYFRLSDTDWVFQELDKWLRRRLRQMVWKRWKRGRTRYRKLVELGVPSELAALGAGGKSPWRMAATPVVHMALGNAYWEREGLANITDRYRQSRETLRTAGCNKARPVV
jgi:group II intron reverse transcriptase/maturase